MKIWGKCRSHLIQAVQDWVKKSKLTHTHTQYDNSIPVVEDLGRYNINMTAKYYEYHLYTVTKNNHVTYPLIIKEMKYMLIDITISF